MVQKHFDSPQKSRSKLHDSPQAKKLSDIQYQPDAPVERLTFGPTPLQTLVEAQRGNSPNSNRPIAPFDSPIKPYKNKRKQSFKVKKDPAEMQKALIKRRNRDSEHKNAKDKLKEKPNDLHEDLDLDKDAGVKSYTMMRSPKSKINPYMSPNKIAK